MYPPCADCDHVSPHLDANGCLWSDDPWDPATDCPCKVYVPPTPVVVSSPTLERARAERDAALEQVEAAASPEWIDWAERAVAAVASRVVLFGNTSQDREEPVPFSTDDVWQYLEECEVPAPREPRALGPVIRRALRDGVIRPDGFTQSRRRHAALIRTYVGGQA